MPEGAILKTQNPPTQQSMDIFYYLKKNQNSLQKKSKINTLRRPLHSVTILGLKPLRISDTQI